MSDWHLPLWIRVIFGRDCAGPDRIDHCGEDDLHARFRDIVEREWGISAFRAARLPRRMPPPDEKW